MLASRLGDDPIGESRAAQLVGRALAALDARGSRRVRAATWIMLGLGAPMALWSRDIPALVVTAAILLVTRLATTRSRDARLPLVLALHSAGALLSWEFQMAGPTRSLFFIATALTVAYNASSVVWRGALAGLVLHVAVSVTNTRLPALALFVVGAVTFALVAAEWAASSRHRVIRNARRRSVLELRQGEIVEQLGRAHLTERRLVDMAANLRETQDALRRDIEKRKELTEQLASAMMRAEDANRAKSAFLARMSHELRTPLNSVIGFSSLLLRTSRARLEAKELEFLERIKSNGTHLLTLINDILDLSKIEAGRMQLEVMPVGINQLVRECVAMLEPQARPGVQLRMELPDDEHVIDTDGSRLRQVLINLAGNALKFTNSGSVTVALRLNGLGVPERLEVIDTGVGIPENRQQAIFEPFEQADNSTARSHGGTGLGLAICRQLCALMGMRLSLVSQPGRGSTFTVELHVRAPGASESITGGIRRPASGHHSTSAVTAPTAGHVPREIAV